MRISAINHTNVSQSVWHRAVTRSTQRHTFGVVLLHAGFSFYIIARFGDGKDWKKKV